MADAATDARASLDRVESTTPGSGRVDLFAFARGGLLGPERAGVAGVGLEVSHRWRRWSVFGRGTAGVGWAGDDRRLEVDVLAGLRGAW